jgi:TRAP-type C4-dicarboxylate transport system substrate-binding protein
MRKRWISISTLTIMMVLISGIFRAAGADAIEWKIAYTPLPGTAYDIFIRDVFPQRIESATAGKLKIKLLPGVVGVLDVLDAVKARRVDGGSILSTSYYGGVVPKWALPSVPGLILNEDTNMPKVINEFFYDEVNKDAQKNWNCRVAAISWWARSMFFSNTGISTLEDFRGIKFRSHSIGLSQLIEHFGGSVVNMPFGELYSALERKVVDAATSAIPPIITSGIFERLKYIDPWPGGTSPTVLLVNSESFNSLPNDVKEIVADLFSKHKFSKEYQDLEIKMARDFVEDAKKKGMLWTVIEQREMDRYIKASKDVVWKKWLEGAGPEGQSWMDKVLELQK